MRANVAKKEVRFKPHLFFHEQYWLDAHRTLHGGLSACVANRSIALSLATVRQTMHESEMPVAIRA